MPKSTSTTARCGKEQAKQRLAQAEAFLFVAKLVHEEPDDAVLPRRGVSAALAVLAGIAGADAMCCARLGKVHRGQDHAAAVDLVGTVFPEGVNAAPDLLRLIGLKDKAHYQWQMVSPSEAKSAVAQAERIVELARQVVN